MICLVGDILTDVTLPTQTQKEYKMRLGGVVHAARGLWAMGVEYAVAYFAPAYLDGQIEFYLHQMGCNVLHKLGDVTGCPYTMLISEVKEVGNQGYEFLYRDCIHIEYNQEEIKHLADYDNLLFISGNYKMDLLLEQTKPEQHIHIDVANNVQTFDQLPKNRYFSTLFMSTSSELFQNTFTRIDSFFGSLSPYAQKIVLKENRGGSRAFDSETKQLFQIPSQTSTIVHSVGVGDVYDAVTVTTPYTQFEDRLALASWVAMHYAKTTFVEDFKRSIDGVKRIPIGTLKDFEGCFLPWEARQHCVIYVAAPDFDFLDTKPIEVLCDSLTYHHFIPRRPVKEVGQMQANAERDERQRLFHSDMAILAECNMLIAVLLYNDPGTLIEIGLAAQRGIPTLVYDPNNMAENCMLTELPTIVSGDLDEIMAKVFTEYSKQFKNGTL